MQNNKEITIVIDFRIYYYLFEPVVDSFIERGVKVYLVCNKDIKDFISSKRQDLGCIEFVSLPVIKRKFRVHKVIHRILTIFFTRYDFSHQYAKRINQVTIKAKGMKRLLYFISRFVPKVANSNINAFTHNAVRVISKNPFPTSTVLVGSLNASPELLCAKNLRVVTLMESWDHTVKIPNGYLSDKVIVWNKELRDDWVEYQNDKNVDWVYPLKLRYAIENINKTGAWELNKKEEGKPMCVYAVASTRVFSVPQIVELERRLIADLCIATDKANWDLLIKPRPHGDLKEFDEFSESFQHVKVGYMEDASSNPADYYLNDEYNAIRFSEVLPARIVINCFTTFGLDAATAGIPVLQLDLRETSRYEDSQMFYSNHHINKYLITDRSTLKVPSGVDLVEYIADYLSNSRGLEFDYTKSICDWLIPEASFQDSMDRLVDLVLGE
ncbi:MAG: hypothetical protein ACI97P_001221 [Arcticibacterium sp.]|jgi:hypothetical protein